MKIGFIGQGWIGKNYADDFEKRGFDIIRYALEEPHAKNKDKIKDCDIVFIAVPTPTTLKGFDDSILREAVKLVGEDKIVVIKSTLLPGTTESIQEENPDIFVIHSPEFLREVTAAYDAANPDRNIIGVTKKSEKKAKDVLSILPKAKHEFIITAKEAEMIKYAGNIFLYFKVIYANLLYDLIDKLGLDYSLVSEIIAADPRIGNSHLDPIHKSGRGAGGHCFIKDFAAFTDMYEKIVGDKTGLDVLEALQKKNIQLLKSTNKDLDLLRGVYGER